MARRSVSIGEARAKLRGLVKAAQEGEAIQITLWGAAVVVLVSLSQYQQLAHERPSFGVALDKFLGGVELAEVGLERGEFEDLRDRGVGRVAQV